MLCLCLLFAVRLCSAQDAQGCKDSPLITRFPGSVITGCVDKEDNLATFPMGTKPSKKLEGEYHQISYKFPSSASKAQVVRNINTALKSAGYTFDYDSGEYGDFTVHKGRTWILVEIAGTGTIKETIITETALKQEVVADAAALSSGLAGTGHMVVNGILFDTGKAEVKPESTAALQEIVKLLQQDPKLKLYVVGHTDNAGALAANVELSRLRAAAVVQMLTGQLKVAADRLQSFGDGPYAPIASNDSEDGRAMNRRVELVKQ
jgi:outer membrane protein OmpA-like peptidoglycan-associated protein